MSWDDEFDEDWAGPDDDPTPTIPCPNCRGEVYAEADSCPHCGEFRIGDNSNPMSGKPLWYIAIGMAGIIAMLLVLSGLIGLL